MANGASVKVAHAYGLRWKFSDELRAVEDDCGRDLVALNGDLSWTLTIPARYVVASDGMIEYADISFDYTPHGDPSELIPVLAHLAAHYPALTGSRKRVRASKPIDQAIPTCACK